MVFKCFAAFGRRLIGRMRFSVDEFLFLVDICVLSKLLDMGGKVPIGLTQGGFQMAIMHPILHHQ